MKRAFARFRNDQMTDHAAALTYYALMSLAPALLACIAVLGVFGQQTLISDAAQYLTRVGAPPETVEPITNIIENALANQSTAITSLVFGLLIALNGASGAFGAAGRALNVVFRVGEGRGFVRRKATDIAFTVLVLLLVLVTLVLVFLGGGLATDVFALFGLGETAASIWKVVRWPIALATAMLVYAVVYFAAPNVRVKRFQWISIGAAFGVVLWLIASAAFFLYAANFGYGAAYGAFAGIVILLVWLWLTNSMLLFGAELNAEIDLRRSPELPESYDGPPLPEKVPAENDTR
ncbi:MAG: YihY/virulence factor BrkB family protein [Actinomycetota bacterium]|nr:YihY/virulence factor BrkB family protein [Actinomycetota bacterium]